MIARKRYSCKAEWEAEDGNADIQCQKCRDADRIAELKAELRGVADTLRKIVAALGEVLHGIDEEVGS